MKTCVLPLSRRNGFEWTMRSRSRWNGVRTGDSSSGSSRPRVSYERTASGESLRSSSSRTRAANVSATLRAVSVIASSLNRGAAVAGAAARACNEPPRSDTYGETDSRGGAEMAVVESVQADSLREKVRGDVIAPGDGAFDEARRVWNGIIDRQRALTVRCTGNADVIATVAFAREHGLPVSVRGGGHNVAGTAVAEGGVVIDLSAMRSVVVDVEKKTVRAGGGARLGDVDHETQAFGLATPFGVVSKTGIAGLTLHGGMGFLTRRLGLSSDNLIAADVVTADGQLLHADADRHPDLLWALRGGGGNFGAVTSFEYRLRPVGPEVFMAIAFYPVDAATDGLRVFREVFANAPDELMGVALYWTAPAEEPFPPDWHGKPVFILAGCWSGPLDQAEAAVKPLREVTTPVA